ncbi:MAG: ADP-ribosylglycohydrolase family protein [Anaerolineae bacterium]|nr:ADP-ribosylglycohydrolase family protein [Anaerolineae bacterium]
MTVTVERARGCLLGQAVGDALGAPVEGLSRDRILRHFGELRDYLEPDRALAGPARPHPPGVYSDDTQQALLIAAVLAEARRFDPELARRRYVDLARPMPGLARGAHRAMGGNFRAALARMADGCSTLQTGVPSAGNGAAMRAAPIGLWYAGDQAGLCRAAIEASLQTHADVRGISAAVAIAFLAGHLASHAVADTLEAREALELAAGFTEEAEAVLCNEYGLPYSGAEPRPPRFSASLRVLVPLWGAALWDVLRTIVIQANRQQPAYPVISPNDSFSCASVVTAIFLALSSPSFEEAVVQAVNLGSDADTVGGLTGALAGARWGAGAIPQRWLDRLANREGLIAHADALVGGTKGSTAPAVLVAVERQLSLAQVRVREGW